MGRVTEPHPDRGIVSKSELAELLRVNLATIDGWVRMGCPAHERPLRKGQQWRMSVKDVVDWLISRAEEKARGKESAGANENDAKQRKLMAEAELAELELAEKRGQAVSIATAQAAWSAMIGSARAKLRGIGSKLGPIVATEIDPFQCRLLIDQAIDEALLELSEEDISIDAGEPDGDADSGEDVPQGVGTATATDR